MEMSSANPRPVQAARPIRGPHGGWQKQEIDALQRCIDEANQAGQSLRSVFERMGEELGRKPNSIRNFYYAQVRSHEEGAPARAMPFETFSPEEVERLVERVLTARAQGLSVRACVRELADGDRTLMLRYQNKYRSTIRTRPELVQRIMQRLSQEGTPFVSPYAPEGGEPPEEAMPRLRRRAEQSGDPQLCALFSSLDHLLNLALTSPNLANGNASGHGDSEKDSDEVNHEAGETHAVRETETRMPGDSEAMRRADRLSAQCDMLRIALADEQARGSLLHSEIESIVSLLKEYIALPEDDRLTHCGAFCQQMSECLSKIEPALAQDGAPAEQASV